MQLKSEKQHYTSDPLQDFEALLRAMIENLPGGAAFVVDLNLHYRLAEGEALSVAGFKPEDLVGRTIFEVLPPDLATSAEVLYRKALAGEAFEIEHSTRDRFYISHGTPLRSASGEVYAVLAVSYDITDRKLAEAAIESDLKATRLLHELSARLVTEGNIQALYQEIMATAIALTRADAGTVQILDKATQDLLLLATHGFERNVIEHFYRVNASFNTPCGIALRNGDRTFVDFDVPESEDPDGSMRIHVEAGYLSAQSTPLVTRSGKAIGMVSTHWRKHHRPSDRELRFLDLLARQAADLIEQRQAQAALRESEEKYRSLFESIDEGYILVDAIFDENDQPSDLLYLEANPAAVQMMGTELVGRRTLEINPNFESRWFETFGRVAKTGIGERHEFYTAPLDVWYDFYVFKVGEPNETRVAAVYQDVSDRKRTEAQLRCAAEINAFQVKLSDALRSLTDPIQMQAEACRLLGEHLGVDRAYYVEVNEVESYARINQNYLRGDSPTLVGTFRLADYGWIVPHLRRGETIIITDADNAEIIPEAERAAMEVVRIGSHITIPLVKAGVLVGALCVTESNPRQWLEAEVELVRATADRIWAAIERAYAEAALRQSEEKYRSLFANVNDGFCIIEMLYEDGQPINHRFLEVNPAFEAQSGFTQAIGKTARDFAPNLEVEFHTNYDRALTTGEPSEFEIYLADLARYFRVSAYRHGDPQTKQLAVIFTNITDRKRSEEQLRRAAEMDGFRLKLSDALRPLSDPVAIQETAMQTLGAYLNVNRAFYGEVLDDDDTLAIGSGYADGLSPIVGQIKFSEFDSDLLTDYRAGRTVVINDLYGDVQLSTKAKTEFDAIQVRAAVGVALVKNEKVRAILSIHQSVPRQWTPSEIALLEETADRTWAAVERARAEADLRESEVKYRSLFESIDEGFALFELIYDENERLVDYRFLEANHAFERYTGLENPAGKLNSQIDPNSEGHWIETFDTVAQTGEAQRLENYNHLTDSWYHVYASLVGAAGSRQVAIVFNDITDRKHRELNTAFLDEIGKELSVLSAPDEIIQTVGARLSEFLQASGCIFADVDEAKNEATIHHGWNTTNVVSLKQTFRLADYFGEEFARAGRAGETVIVRDTAQDERADAEAYARLKIGSFVTVPFQRNGRWTANITVTAREPRDWREDEIGLLQEIINRVFPRIERARAEISLRESEIQRVREQSAREEARQRAETLAELDRAKTLFFSNVSHEFRTPLTLLIAPLQDALSDRTHPLAPPQRERLELAYRNTNRLLKLVNTLLDFSRIEAGRMEAVYEPTDLAMFTTQLASVFRSAIERAGLRLIVDCPPLPELVYIDRQMWEKIVLNLLSNAFKFTLEGEITVRLHPTDGNRAILQIQDTGEGIAPKHLPHLFERFYQVRGTKGRTHEGAGIGLALVDELVRLHGGTIEVSSTLGEGTCFTIALPFGTDHLPSDRLQDEGDRIAPTRTLASTAMGAVSYVEDVERWLPTREQHQEIAGEEQSTLTTDFLLPTSTSARVLLVDDNADMREYLTRILSKHVQVEAVADGAAALAAIREQVPDLVLSDVMMPGLDGFDLLEALRADPRTREVPIILLSARAGEEAIVEGLEAGADDYLIKPFSAQELISRVNTHLKMAQLRSQALHQAKTTIRRKDELLSIVSHELNTPLVSILGWTRLLRNSPPSPSLLTKALDTIERNATLQANLVQDLLDASRLDIGKLRLQLQPVALAAPIETAIATVYHLAEAKGIDLVGWGITDPVKTAEMVMGDRDRLQQIICNLLSNAIKFTPEGGRVDVELSFVTGNLSFTEEAIAHDNYAEIRVTDTGIGIAADFLPHVFDRFRQARDADAKRGLGLGLAIAHHLVELHNGTIHAESAGVGQGATFIVRLPLLT